VKPFHFFRVRRGVLRVHCNVHCHTAFSNASLLIELTDSEERVRLLKHLAQHAAELSSGEIDSVFSHDLQQAEEQADSVRVAAMGVKSSAK
jgi:transcriptional regulator of NAD metabolism